MRFLLREEKIPVYRGVIKGLQPNVEGDGRAEWWTVSKDEATSYWQDGTDDEGALLTSVIDLDKVNLIDLGKQPDVTSVYLGNDLNNILGTKIIARNVLKTEILYILNTKILSIECLQGWMIYKYSIIR